MKATDGEGRLVLLAGAILFVGSVWAMLAIPIAEGLNPSYSVSSESVSGLGVPYFSHNPMTCTTLPICGVPVQPSSAVILSSFFIDGVLTLLGGYLLRKATAHKTFGLGLMVTGALSFLIGVSYIPFYLGTPTSGAIDAAIALHLVGSIGAFLMLFILAVLAYRFVRGPFRYLSLILGVVILASFLLFLSGDYLGVGFGGIERVLIYSMNVWGLGFSAYLLGRSGLD